MRAFRSRAREQPKMISIMNLINENPYMKTEYEKYTKYYRELAEKYFNECIKINIDEIIKQVTIDTFNNDFFVEDVCRGEHAIDDCVDKNINLSLYYIDTYSISDKICDNLTELYDYREEHVFDHDKVCEHEIKYWVKSYRDYDSKEYESDSKNQFKDHHMILENTEYFDPFYTNNVAIIYEELDKIRENKIVPFSQMTMKEIINMKSETVNDFIGRMVIFLEYELYNILARHHSCLQECLDSNTKNILKEMMETVNDSCTIDLSALRKCNEEFRNEYTSFVNGFVDEVMNRYSISFTRNHVTKWCADSGMYPNTEEDE